MMNRLRCIPRTFFKFNGLQNNSLGRIGRKLLSGVANTEYNVAKLKERGIVRVFGRDASKFLQGLLTNNMTCFTENHCQVLYSAALNVQGRTVFDLFIYTNPGEENHFLLECAESEVPSLIRHLKTYKIRSKVEILDARKEIEAWFIFSSPDGKSYNESPDTEIISTDLVAVPDPRLSGMGTRVLMPWNRSPAEMIKDINLFNVESEFYRNYRHKLGIAEGPLEILPGKALPLEYNFGLLNGISFSKGCYLGQELTARTHHTGVIRKRVMPIQLKDTENQKYPHVEDQVSVKTDKGKSAGMVITMAGGYGIGLLRVGEALAAGYLTTTDKQGKEITITCEKPYWWPKDLQY